MPVHQLTFGPVGMPESGEVAHVTSGKEDDVIDMECPECGSKIFIYYRHVPRGGETSAEQKEGDKK